MVYSNIPSLFPDSLTCDLEKMEREKEKRKGSYVVERFIIFLRKNAKIRLKRIIFVSIW
tara:strand:- start:189 stop:365 length:177 start_codon:yes stop_codon:yes gene_type:complete